MALLNQFTLHQGTTAPSVGNRVYTNTANTMSVAITGTISTLSANFECSNDGVNWLPIQGKNLSAITAPQSNTTSSNQIWTFDVASVLFFRVNIVAITGGAITVTGNTYN